MTLTYFLFQNLDFWNLVGTFLKFGVMDLISAHNWARILKLGGKIPTIRPSEPFAYGLALPTFQKKVTQQHFCIGPYIDNAPIVNQLRALATSMRAGCWLHITGIFTYRPTNAVVSGRLDSNWNGRHHRGITHLKYDSDDYSFIFGLEFKNVHQIFMKFMRWTLYHKISFYIVF